MKYLFGLLFFAVHFGLSAQEKPKDSTNGEDLEEIVIQSTRSSRTIRNTPSRIEVIDAEELDEKANMQARSGVTMTLHESTGLQVQQTSATTGNASIRVQGLDGRYTQLLKDGFPNFGNFSSGLTLLELPPLDLKQVEIIKGPASTLYGGGAIAGMINFISKTPKEAPERIAFLNQSHLGQSNMGVYLSQKFKYIGYTFTVMNNLQRAFDVDHDDFSELPKSSSYTIHPKLFLYPSANATVSIGNSYGATNLLGGDLNVIDGRPSPEHTYFEQNRSTRNISTLEWEQRFEQSTFRIKQSTSLFDRSISIPGYVFDGRNFNAYSDVSYASQTEKQTLIAGANFIHDDFRDSRHVYDSKSNTFGAYIQHTWDLTNYVKLESGFRFDFVNYNQFTKNQIFALPRLSALFKFSSGWSSRVGGGLGYKLPSIFTEQTEQIHYRNVLPLNEVSSEKSIGGTVDINYKNTFGPLAFSLNQMFFLTRIHSPLVGNFQVGNFVLANAGDPVISSGFETNAKLIFKDALKLFAGYTFTDARAKYLAGDPILPLTPRNKVNLALIFEKEQQFKFGLEGYFTDRQWLSDGAHTPGFWELGFMMQKTVWKHFDLFANFENFTDVKQADYKRVANGPHDNPTFDEIWTHVEGFVFNAGVKVRF